MRQNLMDDEERRAQDERTRRLAGQKQDNQHLQIQAFDEAIGKALAGGIM